VSDLDYGEKARDAERRPEWRLTGIVFFVILALGILYATLLIIRPFLSAIVLGAILVTITFPIYIRVRKRFHGRGGLAALVMLFGITFLIILPAVLIGFLLVEQANGLIAHMQSGDAQRLLQRMDIVGHLQWLRRFGVDPATLNPQRLILPVMRQIPGWVARNGPAVIGSVAGAVLAFALVLLSAYFFYVEGESIIEQLAILSPMPARYDREFATQFKDVIDATFRGQVMTSLAQGIVTGAGLAIAQVPGAILWGFVATILSLLPMMGAAAVWVPAAIYLYIDASIGDRGYFGAIFLTLWGILIVSTIDNVVRPWAMRGKSQLPAIPLLFAVIGGMQAFGFIGLVIGPLVFSLLMSIIDIYKRSFGLRRSESSVA
jgi:predicted PurR-regulated permease PerM